MGEPFGRTSAAAYLELLWVGIDEELAYLGSEYGEKGGTIAVIVPQIWRNNTTFMELWQKKAAEASWAQPRLSLIDAYESKGLEYDCVLLCEPNAIAAEGVGNLYVAMTRPTRHLRVLCAGEIPASLEASVENVRCGRRVES